MEIACSQCSRSFTLDAARAGTVGSAKCVCGFTLDLRAANRGDTIQQLGKYTLERRIAAGGMGEIYYGKIAGVEGFEREVAIKKLLPHLSADRDFIQMMVKEAKLTVLLNHPNIVQIFDLAKEGDEYYIAMEYVPAINVAKLLESCIGRGLRLPVPVAAHIILQLLKGLGYAHDLRGPDGVSMNVLHRDVTPQNILVTRSGWVKVADFGIAKARNEISTTSPGMIKGKLGYIAPEQLSGKVADQRLDIFCAGIVLWEMLAGRRLFKGIDEIETFRLIVETKIPPLNTVRDDVAPGFETALLGALAADPDERYTHADQFYQALSHAMLPMNADDCAAATKAFLESNPEMFDSVFEKNNESGITQIPTVALSSPSTENVVDISSLLKLPEQPLTSPNRRLLRPLLVVLLVLAFGSALGVLWHHRTNVFSGAQSVPLGTDVADAPAQPQRGELEDVAADDEPQLGPKAKPRPSKPAAPRVEAKPLAQDEIQAAIQTLYPSLLKCLQPLASVSGPAQVVLEVGVLATGRVNQVNVQPALGDEQVQRCVVRSVRSMRLRKSPKAFKFQLPLQVERVRGG